jgi:hypothetical protein
MVLILRVFVLIVADEDYGPPVSELELDSFKTEDGILDIVLLDRSTII